MDKYAVSLSKSSVNAKRTGLLIRRSNVRIVPGAPVKFQHTILQYSLDVFPKNIIDGPSFGQLIHQFIKVSHIFYEWIFNSFNTLSTNDALN